MERNIREIPTSELEEDLRNTEDDIETCEMAIFMHIDTCMKGYSVAKRLEGNRVIRAKILMELKRRTAEKEN